MSMNTAATLAPALRIGANRDEIAAALGEPQDIGVGLRGVTILAYRERTIQCTLRRGEGLFLLAFYFHPEKGTEWPLCLAALGDFSSDTTPGEVEDWLDQREITSLRMSVCDEVVIEASDGVRFHFESELLSSIQMISLAPSSGSTPHVNPRGLL